jgi:hypothetical protein
MKRGRGSIEPRTREGRGRTKRGAGREGPQRTGKTRRKRRPRKIREIESRETRRKEFWGDRPTRGLSRRSVHIRAPDQTRTRSVSRRDRPRIRYE